MNAVLRKKAARPSLASAVVLTFTVLSTMWLVTWAMAIHAYHLFELRNYGAITIAPARASHHGFRRRVLMADYVFTDPASGSSVAGKGIIEMRESSDLTVGNSRTVDVAFLRARPEVNAPNSYILDNPTNDDALPMVFAIWAAALSVGMARNLRQAIRARRDALVSG